jgi:hypothetical protein
VFQSARPGISEGHRSTPGERKDDVSSQASRLNTMFVEQERLNESRYNNGEQWFGLPTKIMQTAVQQNHDRVSCKSIVRRVPWAPRAWLGLIEG